LLHTSLPPRSLPSHRTQSCPFPSPLFFFNDTATTEIYTLSLHDALPIYLVAAFDAVSKLRFDLGKTERRRQHDAPLRRSVLPRRSEEHTSELQSLTNLVCRLLLEKKKNHNMPHPRWHNHPQYLQTRTHTA